MSDRIAPQNQQRELVTDVPIELFELDYSVLVGSSLGDETFIIRICEDVQTDGQNVRFGGKEFQAAPVEVSGFDLSATGASPRPTISIANLGGLVTDLIADANHLLGARLIRRRVFARHLDDGEFPDSTAEWPPQMYRIERKVREDLVVEFELSALPDVEGARIPARTVEWNLCNWVYKSIECGWVPGAGPYFDVTGEPSDVGQDNCGLRLSDCKIRFKAREQPLRYGGFPAVVRVVS